jgi:hypothetical protein
MTTIPRPWKEHFGAVWHTCATCLNGPTLTPILFGFMSLGIPPHKRPELMAIKSNVDPKETMFSMGWAVGIGDAPEAEYEPFAAEEFSVPEARAWLLGYATGRYAEANQFKTPGCKFQHPSEHNMPEVGTFENYVWRVEQAGAFPTNSLMESTVARAIIQPFFDTDQPFQRVVSVVGQAVSLGVICCDVDFGDGNPALVTDWGAYLDSLDAGFPGWFWTNMAKLPNQVRRAALNRRIGITGAHGYEVSNVNFIQESPGRDGDTVVRLDARRRPPNEPHWGSHHW